jgi:hypothetical protein
MHTRRQYTPAVNPSEDCPNSVKNPTPVYPILLLQLTYRIFVSPPCCTSKSASFAILAYATILFKPPKNPFIPPPSSFFFRVLRSVSLLLGLIRSSPAPAVLLLLGRSDSVLLLFGRSDSVRRLTGLSFSVVDTRRDLGRSSRLRSRSRASEPGEMIETWRVVRRRCS